MWLYHSISINLYHVSHGKCHVTFPTVFVLQMWALDTFCTILNLGNNNYIIIIIIIIFSLREEIEGCAYDNHSVSIIRLTNGTILYLREVNRFVNIFITIFVTGLYYRFLALVCLLREDVFERQGLIEYNFHCFRESIQQVSIVPHLLLLLCIMYCV